MRKTAPSLGEDNEVVFGALGYTAAELKDLKARGVI